MPILWNAQAGLAGIRLRTREQSFVGMTSHIWGIVSGSAERGTAVTTLVACCYFPGTDCFLYLRSSTLCYLAIILKGLPDSCSPTATLNFLQCGPISRGNPLPPSPLSTFLYYTRAYLISLFFAQSLPPVSTVLCPTSGSFLPRFGLRAFGFFLGEANTPPKSICFSPGLLLIFSPPLLYPRRGGGGGTTWSQLPVFALELMFSPGPIPSSQAWSYYGLALPGYVRGCRRQRLTH